MKQILSRISIVTILLVLSVVACEEEESFHQISSLETEIYNKVNDYRSQEGLNELVMNMIMFREARDLSDQISNGSISSQSDDIADKLRELTANFGGTNQGWLVVQSNSENADSIVSKIIDDANASQLVKQEYTQAGVGASTDEQGITHVCLLYMNIPD